MKCRLLRRCLVAAFVLAIETTSSSAQTSCLPQYQGSFTGVPAGSSFDFASVQGTGDFNGDGREDVVIVRVKFNQDIRSPIEFLLNDAGSGFRIATSEVIEGAIPAVYNARDLLVGDFNADGRADVFVAAHGVDSRLDGEPNVLLLSQLNGRLVDASANLPRFNDFSHTAAMGDIDRDGDVDIFVGNFLGSGEQPPYMLMNDGSGRFSVNVDRLPPLEVLGNWPTFGPTGGSRLVDIDGDGWLDLVIGDHGNGDGRSRVYVNDGAGRFTDASMTFLPRPASLRGGGTVVVFVQDLDIDRDGRQDLVLSVAGGGTNYYIGREFQVLMNRTPAGSKVPAFVDETTSRSSAARLEENRSEWAMFFSVRDVNRDGLPDLIARSFVTGGASVSSTAPYIMFNTPRGQFVAFGTSFLDSADPVSVGPIVPVDLHGDGNTDFLSVSYRYELVRTIGCRSGGLETAPLIDPLPDAQTTPGQATTVSIRIIDADTPPSGLTLSVSSSNTIVLPPSGIIVSGPASTRTLTLTASGPGRTVVTLIANDGTATTSAAFALTVTAPPTLAAIQDQTTRMSTPIGVELSLSDSDTPAAALVVTASSSNTTVVPASGIVLSGSGFLRTLTLTPAPSVSGTTTVTVMVSDGSASASRSFLLTVTPGIGGLSATVRGNVVTFDWTAAVPGLTGFVFEGGLSSGTTIYSVRLPVIHTFTATAPSGVYYIRVRALVDGNPGFVSEEVRVAIGAAAPPGAPSNLLALVNASVVTLAWENTDIGGAKTGLALEASAPGGALIATLRLSATADTYEVTAPPGSYRLRIRALGPSLQSDASNEVAVAVPSACAAPATPTALTAMVDAGTTTISWRLGTVGSAAPSRFVLAAGTAPGQANVGTMTLTGRSVNVQIPRGRYYVRVSAINACGSASPSTADVLLDVP